LTGVQQDALPDLAAVPDDAVLTDEAYKPAVEIAIVVPPE
jgi:hypothetical protein